MIKGAPFSFLVVCTATGVLLWFFIHGSFEGKLNDARDETTHWKGTADMWESRTNYYKDLASRPVQHEVTAAIPAEGSAPPKTEPAKPKNSSPHKTDGGSSKVDTPKEEKSPEVKADNGIAIGRDNNGTAVVNNVGSLPRVLTPVQMSQIASQIGPEPPNFTGFTCLLGDQEGCGLANQLMTSLRNGGWKIDGTNQAVLNNHLEGIFIMVDPADPDPPDGVLKLYNTLRSAGVPVQGLRMNQTGKGKFGVLVAAHPTSSG